MSNDTYRRLAGLALGAALGFAYGLVSQFLNRLALPGIPLYQPPLGPIGNVVLGMLAGGGLGLLCAWWDSAAQGILVGGAVVAAAIFITIRLRTGSEAAQTFAALILSLPMAWLSLPVVALVRWLAGKQVEARREAVPWPKRLRLPAILAIVVALLAAFELYSSDARTELRQTNVMVQTGLRTAARAELPAPFQAPRVDFPVGARAGYTLEWTSSDLDRFIELRPAAHYDQQSAVIVRFAGGPLLACIYLSPNTEPSCGTY